ncbi:uncharacterized protein LOC131302911 [Rhododendron vialii]|uniref:uncharacterized protein LOC131302911 n=1 Tax=Rhododendron vialii TaxID=182163 RepID=UPI00265D8853|nr:uncharacterized protein LOC131302911 [Rhododendron vialii]
MGCKVDHLPIKYLGLPLGANPKRLKTWDPVVEKIERRLSVWRGRYNSSGGKLTLINSSLVNQPIYFMSIFKMLASVAKMLEKIQRKFFWGDLIDKRKLHLIKWEVICKKKENGYLEVKNLMVQNLSLLAKWWWRFNKDSNSLWVKAVDSALWGDIGVDRWNLHFGRGLRDWETLQVQELKQKLQLVFLDSSSRDSLNWRWSSDIRFLVKSVYNQWESNGHSRSPVIDALWKNLSPPKVEIFAWMAIQSKVATRSILLGRNLILEGESTRCPFCSLHLETPQHLFLHCHFSWDVWSQILDWWHVQWVCPASLEAHFRWWVDNRFRKLEKKLWEATFFATLWSLWLVRNEYVFNNATSRVEVIGEHVKSRVAMWIKAMFDIKVFLERDSERGRESGDYGGKEDGGWIPVLKNHRSQRRDKSGKEMYMLFVDNIPESKDLQWLSKTFKMFGVVKDAFIPRKRSKCSGNKFGFVT